MLNYRIKTAFDSACEARSDFNKARRDKIVKLFKEWAKEGDLVGKIEEGIQSAAANISEVNATLKVGVEMKFGTIEAELMPLTGAPFNPARSNEFGRWKEAETYVRSLFGYDDSVLVKVWQTENYHRKGCSTRGCDCEKTGPKWCIYIEF
jgi:hypothetical protein